MINTLRIIVRLVVIVTITAFASLNANAGIKVLGAQYTADQYFPEFDCYWDSSNYPTSCAAGNANLGATVHIFFQNTNASSITVTNAFLAGYNLKSVIKAETGSGLYFSSIYYNWDNPPQQILDAGEPVWYKADPTNVPAGGVGQMTVRLREVPTNYVTLQVTTTGGSATTNITVDASAPQIASIGYSEDRTKVYIHWRRSGGAAPTAVWVDGTNRTSVTTTVGDASVDYAVSVVSLTNALGFFSYHVYQGVYADGKTATAWQRAWTNKFIYTTWSTFSSIGGSNWVEIASAHGFNNVEMNLGDIGNYKSTSAGTAHMRSKGFGYTILDKTKVSSADPDLWFLDDEPDIAEYNRTIAGNNPGCGTGVKIPCGGLHSAGVFVHNTAVSYAAELRAVRPNVATTVNLDGSLEPQSFFTWGPAVDVLESDNYYEPRLKDAYLTNPNRIPLHGKPKVSYAVARTGSAAASPNPFRHILYANEDQTTGWPYPFPNSKHIEAYYSLAGGSKGLGYWWFNSPEGLWAESESPALWKEMGLIGCEIKTVRDLIVRSTPVNMAIGTNSSWIWARAAASSTNTIIVYVCNDNFINNQSGCQITNVANANITNTLPSWMVSGSTTAFEITKGGAPAAASYSLNGNKLTVFLGTLQVVRMIIITTDSGLQAALQSRYDAVVKPGLCTFAPELCTVSPPVITQQPTAQNVCPGATANFTVTATGSGLTYTWQKNSVNLSNGGHYSGVTTTTLTISSADSNDAANYRCVVTNTGGSATSSQAALSLKAATTITTQPQNQTVAQGGTAQFTVAATGDGTLTYQWQKNSVNLSNGGHYSGVTTTTLTISSADSNDAANYRCVVTGGCGSATSSQASLTVTVPCNPGTLLGHGDMEDASAYTVCPDWASYSAGQGVASWSKETVTIHGGLASQKCRNSNGGSGSLLGVRQTVSAQVGDAFTFSGWVNPVSNPGAGQQVAMVVHWDGSTANPATGVGSWNISSGSKNIWTQLQNLAGNATATSVTLFLDSRRTASSQDLTAFWDDVVALRAFVPPAPAVTGNTSTSLNVNLDPGCNSGNASAEYAITIGGGGYTLGTHWVQANGTVSTAQVWQTDAVWGTKTVTGLTTGTLYTFQVKARYSSTVTQNTSLGASGTGTP